MLPHVLRRQVQPGAGHELRQSFHVVHSHFIEPRFGSGGVCGVTASRSGRREGPQGNADLWGLCDVTRDGLVYARCARACERRAELWSDVS